jgi:hypothetical protein
MDTKDTAAKLANGHRIPRIIYNDDSCTLRNSPPPHTLETLGDAVDYLEGTQVDCLCWCVGAQLAYAWRSKVIENAFDVRDRLGLRNTGYKEDQDVMYSLHRQGIDYLPHLIRRAHARGLMFVPSFRMNDTHHKSTPNDALAPEFWKTHQHYRLWDVTDGKSYYNAALDYSYPEVRNRYRDGVVEVAGEYDVDGIELDFTRSPYFFQPSEAWEKRGILTDFVREIGVRLDEIGRRRGRPLTLILRVASRERALTTAGVDLRQWITAKLAPILIISELSNNYNQDLEPWRGLCRAAGVLLYPAVEGGAIFPREDFYSLQVRNPLAPRHDGGGMRFLADRDLQVRRAVAQNLLAQEPAGIAMFNFPCWLADGANMMHHDPAEFGRVTALLRELGDLKTLAGKDKYYVFYNQLPLYVEASRPRRFHQTISFALRGDDICDATVTLSWRWIAEKNPHAGGTFRQYPIVKPGLIKVYLNDREVPEARLRKTRAPAGRIPSGFLLKSHQVVELDVPGCELRNGENTLAFEMPKAPHERDPYVYVYDLTADVRFGH